MSDAVLFALLVGSAVLLVGSIALTFVMVGPPPYILATWP